MTKEIKKLRKRRKDLGITQAQLSKLANINPNTLAGIEAGYGVLNRDVAQQLWDALGRVESERKTETTVAERQLREQVEKLQNEINLLRGMREAEDWVKKCSTLPWLSSYLPTAKEKLKNALSKFEQMNSDIDDPIIKEVIESLRRETESLQKDHKTVLGILGAITGKAEMEAAIAALDGDPETLQRVERYRATGEHRTLVLDSVFDETNKRELLPE